MNPLATRARLLELEAEMQRVSLAVALAQAHARTRPVRIVGSALIAGAGWLLRRKTVPSGGSWLLGRLLAGLR